LLPIPNNSQTPSATIPAQVVVTVEARHEHENAVPSLKTGDVTAYEGHDRLPVTNVVPLQGENARLQLFLLLDDASSSALGSQLGDLRSFVGAQPATTSVGIAYMRNGMAEVVQNLTANHGDAAKARRLPLSSPGVSASPYLSLRDLIKRWPSSADRREVVLVSSGVDPLGGTGPVNPYLDNAIDDAQRQGIVVYAIYMPTEGHSAHSFYRLNWAQSHLAQIAEETGGEAYMLGFGAPVSFAPYLDEIGARLTHQYRVTLLMKPENKGGFRKVRFATEVPNAELVSASKIYVPARLQESVK
jgi:hypothetical protein